MSNKKKSGQTADPPAVVLGANEMGLAVARDLARHGVRVTLVQCGAGKPPAAHSRFVRFCNAPDIEHEAAVVDWLQELAHGTQTMPVLVPAQDQAVLFIHRHRAALAQRYRFYVWDADVLMELGSKVGLRRVAERYGLPMPRTFSPRSRAEIEQLGGELQFPCIVKPEFTNSWWTHAARQHGLGKKAIEVASLPELLDVHERSERVGATVVVQEKVVGPDANHMSFVTFVAPDGSFSGEMIARKLRVYPVRFGVGSYAESAVIEDATLHGRAILQRLGYRGFASVQFKRDERSGRLYLLEINLRFPLLLALALRAGLSFPYYYYRTSLGRDYAIGKLRVGVRWMSMGRDFRSVRSHVREGTCSWPRWVGELLRCNSFPLFTLRDPMPALASIVQWLRMLSDRWRDRRGSSRLQRFESRGKTPT
jgi:predicted ATP-grasp superfamily ATP-dependent carboligase